MPNQYSLYKFTTFLLLLALAIFIAWTQFSQSENASDPSAELEAPDIGASAPIPVQVANAEIKDLIIRVSATGRTRAQQQLVLTAEVSSRIDSVFVREGQSVKKGEVLATIDDTDFRLKLREAQEQLTKATIEYGEQLGERRQALHRTDGSGEKLLNVAAAEQAYKQAQQNFVAGKITREELLLYERELAAAKIFAETSKKTLIASRSGLAQALVNVERARLELQRTRLFAPFNGVIGNLKIAPGMQVSAGTECLTLVDLSKLLVDIEILESDIALVKTGNKATATFTAFPGETFPGEVIAVNPLIDPEKKTRRATVLLDNRERKLIPGMYSFVKFEAEIHKDRLLVPKEAVVLRDQRPVVFVIREDPDGVLRAKWNYIEIGLQNEEYVEILWSKFNIQPGEPVAISNHYTMIHDAVVKVVE